MTRLQIQNNDFTGTIPATYARMAQMEQFTAEGNKLTGTIPTVLCDLTSSGGGFLNQFVVDCYSARYQIGFNCEPDCCTLCRDVQQMTKWAEKFVQVFLNDGVEKVWVPITKSA